MWNQEWCREELPHLSQTHTTMDILLMPRAEASWDNRAEGQFTPLMTFTSFSYVCLSFLRLRWPDETSSHVLLALTAVVTIVFFLLGIYLLYPPLPLALVFEVCLAGLMLVIASPVDLVLGLTLIVAIPQTPVSVSRKCWWFCSLKP